VLLAGLTMLACAALVNRWTVGLFRGARALDFRDVFDLCSRWSLGLGIATSALGLLLLRTHSKLLARLALSWVVLALFLVADRLLLAVLGLPLWIHDPEAHFRHRPNAVRLVPGGSGKVVRINCHGFHDQEFPVEKPAGELRGLMLGDSVTMGHMLTYEETFSERLEALLDERDRRSRSHQIINAGVQGYSVFQEVLAFRDALRFAPDFVALGFCMNDVTEPFVVQREFGGTGVDYHEVQEESNPLLGTLRNETGIGRLLLYLDRHRSTEEQRKLWEDYNVRDMVLGSTTEPRYREAWEVVLSDLERAYDLAAERRLPLFLLIFPYAFQVYDPAYREPQRILLEHAAQHEIDVLDFTEIFRREVVLDEGELERQLAAGTSTDRILELHTAEWGRFYLDTNHFAPEGHRLVAEGLFDLLLREGLVSDEPRH